MSAKTVENSGAVRTSSSKVRCPTARRSKMGRATVHSGDPAYRDARVAEEAALRLEASGAFRILRRVDPHTAKPLDKTTEGSSLALLVHAVPAGSSRLPSSYDAAAMLVAYTTGGTHMVVAEFASATLGRTPPEMPDKVDDGEESLCLLAAEALEPYARRIDLVVTHGAAEIRSLSIRRDLGLEQKPLLCSKSGVAWSDLGVDGTRLPSILARLGLFADLDVPIATCRALFEVLSVDRWRDAPKVPFVELLSHAADQPVEVVACGPTYDLRDALKARGYRWHAAGGGLEKHWSVIVPRSSAYIELGWLRERLHVGGGRAEIREVRT